MKATELIHHLERTIALDPKALVLVRINEELSASQWDLEIDDVSEEPQIGEYKWNLILITEQFTTDKDPDEDSDTDVDTNKGENVCL